MGLTMSIRTTMWKQKEEALKDRIYKTGLLLSGVLIIHIIKDLTTRTGGIITIASVLLLVREALQIISYQKHIKELREE